MKRFLVMLTAITLVFSFAGCAKGDSRNQPVSSAEYYSEDERLMQAKEDGCVIYENSSITYGQDIWDKFAEEATAERPSQVKLCFYYTLGDPSHYDSSYYESIKDEYPAIYIMDLDYNGDIYTLRWTEEGTEIEKTYQYMMKFEGFAETTGAPYSSYVRYVLTNDNTVTWESISFGMISSRSGDYIDHRVVYEYLDYYKKKK